MHTGRRNVVSQFSPDSNAHKSGIELKIDMKHFGVTMGRRRYEESDKRLFHYILITNFCALIIIYS